MRTRSLFSIVALSATCSTVATALLGAPAVFAASHTLDVIANQAGVGRVDLSITFDDTDVPTLGDADYSIYLAGSPHAELSIAGTIAPVFCCEIEVYDGQPDFFGGSDGLLFRLVSDEATSPSDTLTLLFRDSTGTALSGPRLSDLSPFPALGAWDHVSLVGGPVGGGLRLDATIKSARLRDPSKPAPEPGAALLFGVGTLVVGGAVRRRHLARS